jgi:hypothetical protein
MHAIFSEENGHPLHHTEHSSAKIITYNKTKVPDNYFCHVQHSRFAERCYFLHDR